MIRGKSAKAITLAEAIARYHAQNERQRGGKVWNEMRACFEPPK